MTLEPEGIPETEGRSPERKDMTRRFVIGAILATPIFVLEMGGHLRLLSLDHYVSMVMSMWIQFALATPIVLWCAWPFFQRAWASVLNRSPNMFTLIALGVGASYLYSLVATFAPGLFPTTLRQHGGLLNTLPLGKMVQHQGRPGMELLSRVDSTGVRITASFDVASASPHNILNAYLKLDPESLSMVKSGEGWAGQIEEMFVEFNEAEARWGDNRTKSALKLPLRKSRSLTA